MSSWILGGLVLWTLIALGVGVVVGRGIDLADRSAPRATADPAPAAPTRRTGTPRSARTRRRVPLPPAGIALAACAVALEATGYVVRLTGADGPVARLLEMDAPLSLPRMFVTALFAAAAVAALAGAARIPGRRTWWTGVGLVAGAIAVVKFSGMGHTMAVRRLDAALGPVGAFAASVGLAVLVVAVLGFLSRAERRDRRRVLSCLAAYGVASVGLSALSSVAGSWAAAATFVEESGEALAGVAFLVAVLVGVAPRLVLPADWALRRRADAHTIEVPEPRLGLDGPARG